ncbi:unnamed protein product [Brugia timori]|uniref:DUF5726 domain-containing protein n=1 Tax=Brugia timori TaxID=42155 RepID=A0A0R3QAV2_9BILA|nr:unnamed protein product [Brugia timori]
MTGSSPHLSSPSSSYQGPIRGGLPPPISNVEQMSSDSSSSSMHMGEPKRTVDKTVSSSDSNSGACGTETLPSSKESSNTNKELSDFPDLTDFVNQRTENDLDELFSSRYTMANKLYVEVANGFPDPVIVCPWSKRPKRNFDYTYAFLIISAFHDILKLMRINLTFRKELNFPDMNFSGGQRRSWREDRGRNVNSEWRSGWRNPNYDPYVAHGSWKRRNADADHVRVSYPGRTNS